MFLQSRGSLCRLYEEATGAISNSYALVSILAARVMRSVPAATRRQESLLEWCLRERSRKTKKSEGATSMTALTFNTMHSKTVRATLRNMRGALREAIDAFVVYRVQRAVPEHELRRAEREINKCRRLMNAGHK
jgi:hypothetical protein